MATKTSAADRRQRAEPSRRSHPTTDLHLVARGVDPRTGTFYKVVKFTKPDGTIGEATVSSEQLANGERGVLSVLARNGFCAPVGRALRNKLLAAIDGPQPEKVVEVHSQAGWTRSESTEGPQAYCTPTRVYGGVEGRIRIDRDQLAVNHNFACAGSAEEWIENVAKLARGNRLVVFGITLAFVGPLLRILGGESFGVQYYGPTSRGKSIAGMVAGSVVGGGGRIGFGQSWLTTENALDVTAATHSDAFLFLDEALLGEGAKGSPGSLIPKAAYRLVNGMDKARATDNGARRTWRVVFLSTSEYSLAELAAQAREPLHDGQTVRLIDIPADGGCGMGVFEDLHGAADPATFAAQLKANALKHYGTAFDRFLTQLVTASAEDEGAVKAWLDDRVAQYLEKAGELRGGSGPMRRVAAHFAHVYAAGCLACHYGVLPYKRREIGAAVLWAHRQAALDHLTALAEPLPVAANPITVVADNIRANEGRLIDIGKTGSLTRDEWDAAPGGWVLKHGERQFLFSDEAFRSLCGELNPAMVKTALNDAGLLITHKGGKLNVTPTLPQPLGRVRAVAIHGSILKS